MCSSVWLRTQLSNGNVSASLPSCVFVRLRNYQHVCCWVFMTLVCLCVCMHAFIYFCLSICLSVRLFACLCLYIYIYIHIGMLFTHAGLFVCLCECVHICIKVCLNVRLSVYLLECQSISHLYIGMLVCLSVNLFASLSIRTNVFQLHAFSVCPTASKY